MKKFLKVLVVIVCLSGCVWLIGRYGWKLGGFSSCTGSGIDQVVVTETEVNIHGFYPGSFPSGCVGTVYKQVEDKLYIGVRYDAIFGLFETGQFETTIQLKQPVRGIYLKTGKDEYKVWSKDAESAE